MADAPKAIELMDEHEKALYNKWLNSVLADDTNPAFAELTKQGEAAVWEAVGRFSINYRDVVMSWLVAAGEDIVQSNI